MPPIISKKTLPMRTARIQTSMDLRDPRFRPLVNANGAMAMMDVNAVELDNLLVLGLVIGFNIATDPDGRKEIRILTRSIEFYKERQRPELTWDEIFKLLLPVGRDAATPALTGVELQRSMNCDSGHVLNLVGAKLLQTVKGTDWQRGPGGSPSIVTSSYDRFMKGRML